LKAVLTGTLALVTFPLAAQHQPHTFFKDVVGVNDKEIAQIDSGQVVTKVVPSKNQYGLLVFGATYVNAPVEKFAGVVRDVKKLEEEKVYLVVEQFGLVLGRPVTAADFGRLEVDKDDIDDLASCEVGDCAIQFANEANMEKLRGMAKDKAVNKYALFNPTFRELAAEATNRYLKGGLKELGSYHDRQRPFDMYQETKAMVDSSFYLPRDKAPEIHDHIVEFPQKRMAGAEDIFYYEKIDFGQGPMIRVNHVSLFPKGVGAVKLAAANKQIYASRYIRVALQMFYCVPDSANANRRGFYLIEMSDSRLPDFGGLKMSVVRRIATGTAVDGARDTLAIFKRRSEGK
jgi:hypothetical protein